MIGDEPIKEQVGQHAGGIGEAQAGLMAQNPLG